MANVTARQVLIATLLTGLVPLSLSLAQQPGGPPPNGAAPEGMGAGGPGGAGGPAGGGMGGGTGKEAPASFVAPSDPHVLNGVWTGRQRITDTPPVIKQQFLSTIKQGSQAPGQAALANKDASTLCIPDGYFGTGGGYPNLIMQTASQVTLMNEENHRFRRIYLDGRQPKNIAPSYSGFSLGHWEGDALVVKTDHFKQRVDSVTLPPSFYITEQFRRINNGRVMEYTVRFHSDAYEKPGEKIVTWNWRPDLHIQEQVCEENSDNFNEGYKFK
ncbi:MAG: hypothetical protein QM808_03510 [Steroidobacteraceae bacterium]